MSSQNNNLYNSREARLDTIVGGQTWWPRLFKAREEYFGASDLNTATIETFQDWLETEYGVRLVLDESGAITDEYTVTDEQKFLIFELKYA
jgi:hypothetical protein